MIDVGTNDHGAYETPRVLLSQGITAPYLALSHCWGGKISCVLDTADSFQTAIPWSSLPANFQDAITITRETGCRYIWINSLCIQQDSKSDWETESKEMGRIYRDSSFTISAMASAGIESGILKHDACSPSPQSIFLRVFNDNKNTAEVAVERKDHDLEDLIDLENRGPLNMRGWTLQESVLSPRQLVFGNRQIYWTCSEGPESADGLPSGLRNPRPRWNDITSLLHAETTPQDNLTRCSQSTLLENYYQLVHEFTSRSLSYDSDKLPAFSGIASRLHSELEGDYLAGLWSCDMLNGLLWKHELGTCEHVESYRAPSWSWAVTNQPVVFVWEPREEREENLQIIKTSVVLQDSSNPYGGILSAHLAVQGRVTPLVRSCQLIDTANPEGYFGSAEFDNREKDYDRESEKMVGITLFRMFVGDEEKLLAIRTRPGYQKDWDVDDAAFLDTKYTALLVRFEEHAHRPSRCRGLVLQEVAGQPEKAFVRVGFFDMWANYEPNWLQTWKLQELRLI